MFSIIHALIIALKAHRGQKDKGGHAYIFHPLQVALHVKGKDKKIVALLHDVMEDSTYHQKDFQFLNKEKKEALALLTHDPLIPYMDYIQKIKKNPMATAVKISDLKQNMNLKRLKKVSSKDWERFKKYEQALRFLQKP